MNICQLAEKAFVAWLKSRTFADIPPAQIYGGIQHEPDDDTDTHIVLPCIIVTAEEFEFDESLSGNWRGTVRFHVRSNADDTAQETHQDRVTAVFDTLVTDSIASDASSALPGFTVLFALPKGQGYTREDRSWVSHLDLEIHCAPSEIYAA